MSKKLGENIKIVAGINPAEQAAGTATGTVISRTGFYDAAVHLKVGTASGTPISQGVGLKVQTGDAADGSDLADIEGATIADLTSDNAEAELNLNLDGLKTYIAVVVTTTFDGGTSPTIPIAVTVALGNSISTPI